MTSREYLHGLFNLDGRVAVVIGAGGFLCSEMASAFARSGAAVALLDKNEEAVRAVADRLRGDGLMAVGRALDVTKKSDHESALEFVRRELGVPSVLVNGAGINAPTPVLEISVEEWRAIIDSHATGTLLGCQVFGGAMLEAGRGSIINISSASAGPPLSKAFSYSVAKAAVWNLTQNLAREWAPHGVRVNALRPGFFPTEWSRKNFITKEREAAILGHTPMGRFGEPAELAGAVVWLASDAARFVTGSHVTVDGGFLAMTI